MPTTLSDQGRVGKHGEIPFYYAFPFRFFFGQNQITPDDVLTWCQNNCDGYYKVVTYTHKSSKRSPANPRKFLRKVIYVDRIYLSSEHDALQIKLMFDVTKTKVMRPRLPRLKEE